MSIVQDRSLPLNITSPSLMSAGKHQANPELCESCQLLDLTQLLRSDDTVSLGPIEAIFARPQCALCALVTSIFVHPWIQGGYAKEMAESEVEDPSTGVCFLCGRRQSDADFLWLMVPTARFPGGAGPADILKGRIYLASGGSTDPSLEKSQVARVLEPKIDFGAIRRWLTDCDGSHHTCIRAQDQYWQRMPAGFRLIDIQRRCLVKPVRQPRYFALSYVWGASSSLRTTKSTIHQFSVDGGFDVSKARLPAVIESAMEFLEGLSERYLWVDALCIVQDDEADLADQISKMDAVYSSAYATLVAAAATSSQSRLLGLPSSPRVVKQTVKTIQGNIYVAGSSKLLRRLSETVWDTRGWTYQERELSSRCIYVFDDECFFECENDIRCESSALSHEAQERSWSIRRGILSLNTQPANSFSRNYEFLHEFIGSVHEYTSRKLTNSQDISNAFAGLCTAIQTFGHTRVVSGIPVEFLLETIFWEIEGISTRRLSTFSHQGLTCIFPSWSWFGWMGVTRNSPDRTHYARPEIDPTLFQIQKQVIDLGSLTGIPGLSDCWGEVLRSKGWLAKFRISHRDLLIQKGSASIEGNYIGWRVFDKTSRYCGVAKLTAVIFEDASADYVFLLISRSRVPEAIMHIGAARHPTRAVKIQSKEEVSRYLSLSLDSADWPKQQQADTFISFEERDWACLNVLVLRYLGAGQVYERIGTAQIHEDAWTDSGPEMRDFSII